MQKCSKKLFPTIVHRLVEVLHVEYLEILNRLRVSSSLDPQLLSQCFRVQLAIHF